MKSNVFSTIFGISSFLIAACSSDSGSGADSINSLNPTNPSTSTCALANKYLPAYPVIAYEDAFGGGCQATVQISVAQATEYSNLLVANGFEQTPLSTESFSYKKNISMDSALSMTIVYSAGTLVISVQEIAREYEFEDLSLIAENFVYEGVCVNAWNAVNDGSTTIFCDPKGDLDALLLSNLGWKEYNGAFFYQYNSIIYQLHLNIIGTCNLDRISNPSQEVKNLF